MYFSKKNMSGIPRLNSVFKCMQTIKCALSHAFVCSFIVFKYVNLIPRKENTFRENQLIFLRGMGRS